MPSKALDLFSAGTMAPEGRHHDLAVSLDGRYVFMHSEEYDMAELLLKELATMYVLDTVQLTFKQYDLDEMLRGNRTHFFTFVMRSDIVAMVLTVEIRKVAHLAVFTGRLEEEEKRVVPIRLIGQAIRFQAPHLISCQWGTELFVIPCERKSLHICRFNTDKGSVSQHRLNILRGSAKDAVAFDDRLFLLSKSGLSWFNPRYLLIVEFEKKYLSHYVDTRPDPVHLFPKGQSFGMDQWDGCMWILTTDVTALTEPRNELWKLDLSLRQWTKITVDLPHSIVEPLVHCLPMGKCFVLGDCPEFPTSWLPAMLDDLPPNTVNHCATPAHLYSFWLDVPRLGRLALETIKKHFPGLDLNDPHICKKMGIPKVGM